MTGQPWHATARALKDRGVSQSEIARRVGKDRRTVSDLFREPPCPRCGGRKVVSADVCLECRRDEKARAHAAKLDEVQEMWEQGLSTSEIAVRLGYSPNSHPPILTELRQAGRIEYRYPKAGERETARRAA